MRQRYTTTVYEPETSSSSCDDWEPSTNNKNYNASLASYVPNTIPPTQISILPQSADNIGTRPIFTKVSVEGNGWMIDGGSVTIPVSGSYLLTIDVTTQQSPSSQEYSGYSSYATLNGTAVSDTIGDTLSTVDVSPSALFGLAQLSPTHTSTLLRLKKGDTLTFWATRIIGEIGAAPLIAYGGSALAFNNTYVSAPWYRVTLTRQ